MAQENRTLEPIKMGSTGLDQLSKNLSSQEMSKIADSDLGEQIAKNWKNILWGIVLAVALGLGFNALKEGQARSAGAASERFEAVQRDFQSIVTKSEDTNPETAANTRRAFEDNLRAITDLDSRSIYGSYAELYRAAEHLHSGNPGAALEALKPFELNHLTGKLDAENLLLEQALLLKAKALLGTADRKEEGKELLKGLATQGRIVSGEALLSYLRVFGSDAALVDQTLTKNPGLREILKEELTALGASKRD